jgi:cation/acetate symporter
LNARRAAARQAARHEAAPCASDFASAPFPPATWRLHRILALYVLGCWLSGTMLWAEEQGLSRHWIGPIFLFSTVMVYAGIGVYARTSDAEEYYAGRRIPPFYNGMAAAADWMSAASFISLSGALYLQGFREPGQPGGLAYVLGWTGGFCLVGHADCPICGP